MTTTRQAVFLLTSTEEDCKRDDRWYPELVPILLPSSVSTRIVSIARVSLNELLLSNLVSGLTQLHSLSLDSVKYVHLKEHSFFALENARFGATNRHPRPNDAPEKWQSVLQSYYRIDHIFQGLKLLGGTASDVRTMMFASTWIHVDASTPLQVYENANSYASHIARRLATNWPNSNNSIGPLQNVPGLDAGDPLASIRGFLSLFLYVHDDPELEALARNVIKTIDGAVSRMNYRLSLKPTPTAHSAFFGVKLNGLFRYGSLRHVTDLALETFVYPAQRLGFSSPSDNYAVSMAYLLQLPMAILVLDYLPGTTLNANHMGAIGMVSETERKRLQGNLFIFCWSFISHHPHCP